MTPHRIPGLDGIPNLLAAVSTVSYGNMAFLWGSEEKVRKNRIAFFRDAGISAGRAVAMQIEHGTNIVEVEGSFAGRGIMNLNDHVRGDALVTREGNLFLFLLTGDCIPLILYDPVRRVVALAHVSRMNSVLRFATVIVNYFRTHYGSSPVDLAAAIGPAIHEESYIFKEADARTRLPEWGKFITPRGDGTVSIDLIGWNVQELAAAGLSEGHIIVDPTDTEGDLNFFSHVRSAFRTHEPEGRFATIVGMSKKK